MDAKPSKAVRSEEAEDESQDEEEEEDDGPDGVPELPVVFKMSSHHDLSHHFKIICQLFVRLAVRSPSRRMTFIQEVKAGKHANCFHIPFHVTSGVCSDFVYLAKDGYFYAALSTVRRKIMRDSLITSSTWQTNFKRFLERYPVFTMTQMDFTAGGCDASNLGARKARLVGRVSGEPYDRCTFEVRSGSPEGHKTSTQLTQLIAGGRRF